MSTAPPSYNQASAYPAAPEGGYGGQAPYPTQQPNPPYPTYSGAGDHPQTAYKPQTAYPTGTAYAPDPQPVFYQGGPYQPTTAPTVNQSYEQTMYDDEAGIVGTSADWAGSSFSNKKIRHTFIKKVYLILMAQLTITFAVVCFFMFHEPTRYWVQRNNWFYWCSYAIFLVTYITLVCCEGVRRRWPGNFICLAVFTLAFSYMAGTITSYYQTESVLIALGITAAVCISISLFAIQTKIDFTLCSGLIFAAAMALFFFGFACMIFYLVAGPNRIVQCVYGGVAALIFSLFLIFDTQMIVGGQKRRYQLSPEEHIFGALQLYLDVVYIFLIVLSLVGGGRRS